MALDFFAGCVGGVGGVVVGHPFDTIKVKLQTDSSYKNAMDVVKKTVKAESVRGLYKGMASPMAGVAAVNALAFGAHSCIMRRMKDPEQLTSHAIAGAGAGFIQAFVISPMELIKTRMQIQSGASAVSAYKGPIDCMRKILRTEGFKGVFRGQGITILREVPALTSYFVTYEMCVRKFTYNDSPSALAILTAGGLAGTASWSFTYPIDVIKSRLQADGVNGENKYRGAMHCLKSSVALEGTAFLLRGLSTAIVRAFPTNAATFYLVSWVMDVGDEFQIEEFLDNTLNMAELIVSRLTSPICPTVNAKELKPKSKGGDLD